LAPWQTFSTVFTNAKAGMDQVDAEHVRRVVYEASVGSAFHANERRKEEAAAARTAEAVERAGRLAPAELARHAAAADARLARLEASRDLSRCWMVVDFDAFFASVEEQKDPALRDKPMAVGGGSMICTANYEARRYGVRSAMPGFIALKLCPQLVFVRPDFESYKRASALGREALAAFDPDLEMASLDEAYLDVTALLRRERERGDAGERGAGAAAATAAAPAAAAAVPTLEEVERLAARVRAAVRERTGGLTCSVGAAPNRTLAKICADLRKPDGQYVLPCCFPALAAAGGPGRGGGDDDDDHGDDGDDHGDDGDDGGDKDEGPPRPRRCCSAEAVRAFVSSLPIRKVPGVGRVTERALAALGVRSCADVLERRAVLSAVCSPSLLDFLFCAALGLGATRHAPRAPPGELRRKGISCERTFPSARSAARGELEPLLESLAASLAEDMAREGLEARTLTLKLKLARTFELRTRSATLDGGGHASAAAQMLPVLRRLLRAEGRALELRLMGVRASGLRVTRERRRLELAEAGGEAAAGGPIERMLARQQQQQGGSGGSGRAAVDEEGGGPAAAAAAAAPEAPVPSPPRPQAARARWACGACTLLNPPLSLRCEACGERKGGEFGGGGGGGGGGGARASGGGAAATAAVTTAAAAAAAAPAAEAAAVEAAEAGGDDRDDLMELLMCGEGDGDDATATTEVEEEGDGDDPIPGGASAYCDRCGARLDAHDAQEHADYHFAVDLEARERQQEQQQQQQQQQWKQRGGPGQNNKRPAQHSIERYLFTASGAAAAAAAARGTKQKE
jgi:DNA polymerase kappa